MKHILKPYALALSLLGAGIAHAPSANAGDYMQFSDFRVTAQAGDNFVLDPQRQQTLTLEQSSGWNFGDVYWFVDYSWYDGRDTQGRNQNWYGEFSPRFSFNKLADREPGKGLIRDVLIATTVEHGMDADATTAYLVGLGVDLNIPGMSYANANVYARKQAHNGGFDTWQLTLAGAKDFTLGNQKFMADGFMDYVAPGGPSSWNLHFSPQIKWDMGANWGQPGRWYAGIEYHYWKNKYGVGPIPGLKTTENTVGILLQARFQ